MHDLNKVGWLLYLTKLRHSRTRAAHPGPLCTIVKPYWRSSWPVVLLKVIWNRVSTLRYEVDPCSHGPTHRLQLASGEVIGVSKICCPVCWELIQALIRKRKQIRIRGRHSSLYLVELPPGLPYEITSHLLKRFKGFAKTEVKKMLNTVSQSASKHRHAPSGESVAAVFSGSESSESEEE